ncbi:hypothetical protein HGH93_19975 [Chitinophaga polysaccharea]|uniref:hypothetical protein n=1 Tax=Chitinophaga TaxID=79328 RepID=UPI0014554B14|nr:MULTISPECIES: hypothetical protein [Chitinophaga]NLR60400.1 hypothetical protein [Chitinophaga polysaccharea]NLU90321.1 hypothetical protein [Chitinophaga sp. Ak27]
MKKIFKLLSTAMVMLLIISNVDTSMANTNLSLSIHAPAVEWKKSTTGTWPGMKDGKIYWYKLDKNASLWWSADGKKWAAVKDGLWADKEGKWLKIYQGKLVWSTDGKQWSEVPDWKWEGSDGKWYKFDAKWSLWVNE